MNDRHESLLLDVRLCENELYCSPKTLSGRPGGYPDDELIKLKNIYIYFLG